MTMTDPGVELVHAQPLALSVEQARSEMQRYRDMCQALLDPREDMQRVGDKDFTKRSGFQKLAAAYGVSTEIRSLEIEREQDGGIRLARAIVHATHPNGRYAEGDGACSVDERRFRRGAEKIEHDLPATAVTRATNRAVSNLIAFGVVSAEEAEAEGGGQRPGGVSLPAWAVPVDVGTAAKALHHLLENAGVPQDGRHKIVTQIGNEVLDRCDGAFPQIVLDVIGRLAEALFVAHAEEELNGTEVDPATGEIVDETTTTTTTETDA